MTIYGDYKLKLEKETEMLWDKKVNTDNVMALEKNKLIQDQKN